MTAKIDKSDTDTTDAAQDECFVLMPISDQDGYKPGHFRRVYEDIFAPACQQAGYRAVRGDDIGAANLIQLDILQRLLQTPVAICDLSSRNPNVLFELGLRQAFDMPVVLVQEVGTVPIFDIAPLRYIEYRRERLYHEVIEDQKKIAHAIRETVSAHESKKGVNSLVRLLGLTKPASIEEVKDADADPVLQIIRAELNGLRQEIRALPVTSPRRQRTLRSKHEYLRNTVAANIEQGKVLLEALNRDPSYSDLVEPLQEALTDDVSALYDILATPLEPTAETRFIDLLRQVELTLGALQAVRTNSAAPVKTLARDTGHLPPAHQ